MFANRSKQGDRSVLIIAQITIEHPCEFLLRNKVLPVGSIDRELVQPISVELAHD